MLIGRHAELTAIADRLAPNRLVTLTGPGGVGKTALAREIVATHTAGDVYFVDLAGLTDDGIREGVAGALRFRSCDHMLQALAPSLLVLDNCEHVLDEAAEMTAEILAADGMSVLATSREALGAVDEWVLEIHPLETAGSPSPAEELFAYEAARRGFADKIAADPYVAELCRRLDGLPLALELAATRLVALTPLEILDHISERLDLLSRKRARGPERHQSLAAAIGWSYALLDDDQRRILAELSLLPSPFTLDAAAAVAALPQGETAKRLAELVERSLLVHVADESGSTYRMLETIRTFGAERLDKSRDEVEGRLSEYALETAAQIAELAKRVMPESGSNSRP